MSVQTGSPEMFSRLYTKALSMSFNRTLDVNYSETLRQTVEYYDTDGIKLRIATLCDLNEDSYNARYDETPNPTLLSYFIDWYTCESMDVYQFLKSLYFINYNIEVRTITDKRQTTSLTDDETKTMTWLHDVIADVEKSIIHDLPEYKKAVWSL